MTCSHCGAEVSTPHTCSYCDREFCDDHRLPENHDCPFQAQAARPTTNEVATADSGVEEPEPLDLEPRRTTSSSSSVGSSPPVETTEPEQSPSTSESETTDHARDFEVAKIRAVGLLRNVVRLVGLVAVLVGMYHLLLPLVDPTLPIWAPWRVFGLTAPVGSEVIFHVGDVVLIAAGAIVAWFI